ncbi:MAG: helix-turn-helix transcriptional regulator [Gammaproteobacteria bacterium]
MKRTSATTRAAPSRSSAATENLTDGFIRTLLAGPNGRLSQAFENAWTSPHTSRVEGNTERGIKRFLIDRNLPNASGRYELFSVRDQIRVVIEDLQNVGPRLERAPGENLISFRIQLAGEFIAGVGVGDPVHFHCPHLGARFQPRGTSLRLYFPAAPIARSVTLFCSPQFLLENLVTDRDMLPQQAIKLLTASAPDFSYCRLTVTAEIIECASALMNNAVTGLLRLPYAEAKTLELLTLCIAAFGRLEDAAIQQFSEVDVGRFHKAREILASKFSPPPTIASLARELAINETKLKSGFKALFGHTIFEYGHECRMQHALHLLRDKRIRISKVAEAVGYQHQGTFASAFKAHFGIRPKDVRHPREPEVEAPSRDT